MWNRGDRIAVKHPGGGREMTKQSHALETDINQLLARWLTTGQINVTAKEPTYGDFSGVGDYHDAMNRVIAAQEEFNALPAQLKKACGQDPGILLEMMKDPDQREELEKLGLAKAKTPAETPVAPEAPETPEAPPAAE